ncbi:iron ABC transporter permease, partial [Bacillus sp. SIMBA_154]
TIILLTASALLVALRLYIWTFRSKLAVIAPGKEHAMNLRIDYDGNTTRMLMVIAVLVSNGTPLVGANSLLG